MLSINFNKYLNDLGKYRTDIETDINFADIKDEYSDLIEDLKKIKKRYEDASAARAEELEVSRLIINAKSLIKDITVLRNSILGLKNNSKTSKDDSFGKTNSDGIKEELKKIDNSSNLLVSERPLPKGFVQEIENKITKIENKITQLNNLGDQEFLQPYKEEANELKVESEIILTETRVFSKETELLYINKKLTESDDKSQYFSNEINRIKQDINYLLNRPITFIFNNNYYTINLGFIFSFFGGNFPGGQGFEDNFSELPLPGDNVNITEQSTENLPVVSNTARINIVEPSKIQGTPTPINNIQQLLNLGITRKLLFSLISNINTIQQTNTTPLSITDGNVRTFRRVPIVEEDSSEEEEEKVEEAEAKTVLLGKELERKNQNQVTIKPKYKKIYFETNLTFAFIGRNISNLSPDYDYKNNKGNLSFNKIISKILKDLITNLFLGLKTEINLDIIKNLNFKNQFKDTNVNYNCIIGDVELPENLTDSLLNLSSFSFFNLINLIIYNISQEGIKIIKPERKDINDNDYWNKAKDVTSFLEYKLNNFVSKNENLFLIGFTKEPKEEGVLFDKLNNFLIDRKEDVDISYLTRDAREEWKNFQLYKDYKEKKILLISEIKDRKFLTNIQNLYFTSSELNTIGENILKKGLIISKNEQEVLYDTIEIHGYTLKDEQEVLYDTIEIHGYTLKFKPGKTIFDNRLYSGVFSEQITNGKRFCNLKIEKNISFLQYLKLPYFGYFNIDLKGTKNSSKGIGFYFPFPYLNNIHIECGNYLNKEQKQRQSRGGGRSSGGRSSGGRRGGGRSSGGRRGGGRSSGGRSSGEQIAGMQFVPGSSKFKTENKKSSKNLKSAVPILTNSGLGSSPLKFKKYLSPASKIKKERKKKKDKINKLKK